MNMPGFTAEASLYTTTEHYEWIRNPSVEAGKHGVIPQQFALPYPSCWIEYCFYVGENKICVPYNWCTHL
jgi:hypothetical protein